MIREREHERERGIDRLRETMRDIARFRIVRPHDLVQWHYRGDQMQASRDLQDLQRANLLRYDRAPSGGVVLSLTEPGYRQLEGNEGRRYQRVTPASERYMHHDAQVYPLYAEARQRIEAKGGRVSAVLTEGQLRREINRLGGNERGGPVPQARKKEIARQLNLHVVDGQIRIPDVRLEYEDRMRTIKRLDLDVTTGSGSYTGRDVARKDGAGMHLKGDNHRGSTPWDNHHIWR